MSIPSRAPLWMFFGVQMWGQDEYVVMCRVVCSSARKHRMSELSICPRPLRLSFVRPISVPKGTRKLQTFYRPMFSRVGLRAPTKLSVGGEYANQPTVGRTLSINLLVSSLLLKTVVS